MKIFVKVSAKEEGLNLADNSRAEYDALYYRLFHLKCRFCIQSKSDTCEDK